jgi:hypothetical protein
LQTLTENLRERLAARDKAAPLLTRGDVVVHSLITAAASGDLDAIRFIFERIDGPAFPAAEQTAATLHRERPGARTLAAGDDAPWREKDETHR